VREVIFSLQGPFSQKSTNSMVYVDWTATVPEHGTVEVEVTLPQVSFSHADCWTQTSKKASEGRELRAQPWWTGGLLKCVGTYTVTTGEVDFGGGSGGLIFGIIVIILLLVRALISTF